MKKPDPNTVPFKLSTEAFHIEFAGRMKAMINQTNVALELSGSGKPDVALNALRVLSDDAKALADLMTPFVNKSR